MTLTYIYHSGFALETERCVVIFDYYEDPANVVPPLLDKGKRIYVLASHFHPDHFVKDIFGWKRPGRDIVYVLSKDILRHRRAQKGDADAWLVKGGTFEDDGIKVEAFGSTDSGVSFVLSIEGRRIFHAGDLNNWHWRDESSEAYAAKAEKDYLGELGLIRAKFDSVDVAMFPVDARIGSGYMLGAQQFVESIKTGLFVPMHFTANGFASAAAFAPTAAANGCKFWAIKSDGESIGI